jgi:ribonuclease HI
MNGEKNYRVQCQNSLQGLSIHNEVQLFWVPGHCGIIGNEEADSLLEVGSKSSFCGPEPCLLVPRSLMTHEWQKNGCQVIIFLTGIWLVDLGNPKFG